jgi:nucleoside-diphosphate-sugar epimerase
VFLKKVYKKKIVITGGKGILGSYFFNKYKKKYNIILYPHRLENFKKMKNWLKKKSFNYFIHFAAITSKKNIKYRNINLINIKCSIELLKNLSKIKSKDLKYFLFISSSHVYGFSKNRLNEKSKRMPVTKYGKSKKIVEDYIIKNIKNFSFNMGIARIFNYTFKNQKKGHFIPDVYKKISLNQNPKNINKNRDFIHIDDVARSLELMIRKKIHQPLNICRGVKVNLITLSKKLNEMTFKKNIIFNTKRLKNNFDIYGNNRLLNKLGINNFKNLDAILKSFINGNKKKNFNNR